MITAGGALIDVDGKGSDRTSDFADMENGSEERDLETEERCEH